MKKVSVTGAGRLREPRGVGDRWLLTGACPANNKYGTVLEIQKNPAVLNDIFVLLRPILYNPTI